MTPHYADDSVTLHHGDCLDVLATLPEASVDAVVTDPPYGLGFMGKTWDSTFEAADMPMRRSAALDAVNAGASRQGGRQRASEDYQRRQARDARSYQAWCEKWARECLRVLKPGGHMLAFGGTRTAHRLACAIEDAGFELRDTIAWLYGSGFPKSRNLDGDWQGWGTALKPANEPIVVARKSPIGTVAANVLVYGTGALNIDACRMSTDEVLSGGGAPPFAFGGMNPRPFHDRHRAGEASADRRYTDAGGTDFAALPGPRGGDDRGRWPTNVVLDPETAADLDRQSGSSTSPSGPVTGQRRSGGIMGTPDGRRSSDSGHGDSGGASRFFPTFRYEAKAPTDERPRVGIVAHPTVKPLDLMRWLVRLVTPPGGVVLEPFAGSGTTAEACIVEGFRCIAIEREADYLPLILARITKPIEPVMFGMEAS